MGIFTEREGWQEPIIQFSVYADNKVGRLNELIGALTHRELHILAFTVIDTTDSAIIRMVCDYHSEARDILKQKGFAFNEVEVFAVEVSQLSDVHKVTCALVQAEVNVHYIYPFIGRANGSSAFVLRMEDNDIATSILKTSGIKVLSRNDLTR